MPVLQENSSPGENRSTPHKTGDGQHFQELGLAFGILWPLTLPRAGCEPTLLRMIQSLEDSSHPRFGPELLLGASLTSQPLTIYNRTGVYKLRLCPRSPGQAETFSMFNF